VPWPGSGKCGNCGYKIKGQDYESIIRGIAAEASKYLGKQMAEASKHKKLTRSKGWPALVDDKPEKVKCVECDSFHVYKRIGEVAGHVKVKLAEIEGAHVAYYPTGGQPCRCFDRGGGNPRFRESVSVSSEGALADMAVGYHSAADVGYWPMVGGVFRASGPPVPGEPDSALVTSFFRYATERSPPPCLARRPS